MAAGNRIVVLDALRGVLALSVVGYHAGLILHIPWLFGHGGLAVDIFFVMSGVVISRAHGGDFATNGAFATFAKARFVRLYPLYLMGTLIGAAAAFARPLFGAPERPATLILAAVGFAVMLAPLPAGGGQSFPLNGPSWSLMSEAIANVAFALTAGRNRLKGGVLMLGGAVIVAAALQPGPLLGAGTWSELPLGVSRALFGFTAGVFLQEAEKGGRMARWPRVASWAPISAAMVIVLAPRTSFDRVFDPVAVLVLSPMIVAAALVCRQRRSRWSSPLAALSYPLYMLHMPVFAIVQNIFPSMTSGDRGACWLLGGAAATAVGLAALTARTVEPALTLWANRITGRVARIAPSMATPPASKRWRWPATST